MLQTTLLQTTLLQMPLLQSADSRQTMVPVPPTTPVRSWSSRLRSVSFESTSFSALPMNSSRVWEQVDRRRFSRRLLAAVSLAAGTVRYRNFIRDFSLAAATISVLYRAYIDDPLKNGCRGAAQRSSAGRVTSQPRGHSGSQGNRV